MSTRENRAFSLVLCYGTNTTLGSAVREITAVKHKARKADKDTFLPTATKDECDTSVHGDLMSSLRRRAATVLVDNAGLDEVGEH
jgi:hypothetical protein